MTAGYQPVRPEEPQLSPEQEDAGWALIDAMEAAKASGDAFSEIDAITAFLDWQMSVGLLTREEWRAMCAPFLLDVIAAADDTPQGRAVLEDVRTHAMEALNGTDYAERAGAALFIVSMDAVQSPRQHDAEAVRHSVEKVEWINSLRSIETRTNLACLLLWPHAFDCDDTSPRKYDIQEAHRAAVASMRKARGLLERMGEPVGGERHHHKRPSSGGAE